MKIDLFVWVVRDPKKIIKKLKSGQQHLCGGGTPKDGELKLGKFVERMDFVNPIKFHLFLINSFRASGMSKMRIYS
jgi:hypothetical protein